MRNSLCGVAAVSLLALLAAPIAGAACANPPKSPEMPQGASASAEDMKEGHDALQKFVNGLEVYENCMQQMIKDAPPDTKPEIKQRWQANADAAVDAAHEIADIYSIQLRAFKARQ